MFFAANMEVQHTRRPTVRGLASRLKSAADSAGMTSSAVNSEDCNIYSNRVAEMFRCMPQLSFAAPHISTSSGQTGLFQGILSVSSSLHCFTGSAVTRVCFLLFGGVTQWLGHRCLAGGLSLPCAQSMVVGKLLAVGQLTRPTQPSILSGSADD